MPIDKTNVRPKSYALKGEDETCDICNGLLYTSKTFYDGKTKQGPWAWMCKTCHMAYGQGVGTGLGQEYDSKTKEKLKG